MCVVCCVVFVFVLRACVMLCCAVLLLYAHCAGQCGGDDDPRVARAYKTLVAAELAGDPAAIKAAQTGLVAAEKLQAATHDGKVAGGRPAAAAVCVLARARARVCVHACVRACAYARACVRSSECARARAPVQVDELPLVVDETYVTTSDLSMRAPLPCGKFGLGREELRRIASRSARRRTLGHRAQRRTDLVKILDDAWRVKMLVANTRKACARAA